MLKSFTCDDCPLRSQCVEPCAAVESMLPPIERGLLHQFRRKDALRNAIIFEDKRRITRVMLSYRDHLEGRMGEIFNMTYNQRMSQQEIARALNISRRSVARYLHRAYRVIGRIAMNKPGDRRQSLN